MIFLYTFPPAIVILLVIIASECKLKSTLKGLGIYILGLLSLALLFWIIQLLLKGVQQWLNWMF